jgi:hypothetical protein
VVTAEAAITAAVALATNSVAGLFRSTFLQQSLRAENTSPEALVLDH